MNAEAIAPNDTVTSPPTTPADTATAPPSPVLTLLKKLQHKHPDPSHAKTRGAFGKRRHNGVYGWKDRKGTANGSSGNGVAARG
jgi:hypothetical protein